MWKGLTLLVMTMAPLIVSCEDTVDHYENNYVRCAKDELGMLQCHGKELQP